MKSIKTQTFLLLLLATALLFTTACSSDDSSDPNPTCFDGIQNQDETDVDCGGACTPCVSCTDGIQNGDETGVDCGGSNCDPCTATCDDGILNGDETGVDCGGSCDPCPVIFMEHITCNINGVPFEAGLVSAFDDLVDLKFQSDQSQERQLFFVCPSGLQEGTYDIINDAGFEVTYAKILDGEFTTESGSLVVTDRNPQQSQLTGTFEFTAVEYEFGTAVDTVFVTDGSFGIDFF